MQMYKGILYSMVFIFLSFISVQSVHASDYEMNIFESYSYSDSRLQISIDMRLRTLNNDDYIRSYSLIASPSEYSQIRAFSGEIEYEIVRNNDYIDIFFPEDGKDLREFTVYLEKDETFTNSNLKEIVLPNYYATSNINVIKHARVITFPSGWGEILRITPEPVSITSKDEETNVLVNLESVREDVYLVIGDEPVYDLSLSYQIMNPTESAKRMNIAIPMNVMGYQEVYIESIIPKPKSVEVDLDGNVLAWYQLESNQRLDISLSIQIKLQSQRNKPDEKESNINKERYVIGAEYWEVNDPSLMEVINALYTVEDVYSFVTNHLEYRPDGALLDSTQRKGGVEAFSDPKHAVCTEYTDLMITLLRSIGIPAREVNGYAFTDDSSQWFRPTVSDVLHSWVQYWDDAKGWVQVDPTWGSTSNIDYLNEFDVHHLGFVQKGLSSIAPQPAGTYRIDEDATLVKVTLSESTIPEGDFIEDWINNYAMNEDSWLDRLLARLASFFGRLNPFK